MTHNLPDTIIDTIIDASLFDKKQAIQSSAPLQDNVFGVFVTVIRSRDHAKTDKIDKTSLVHGCIGYWNDDYSVLSQDELFSHALRVGHAATYDDDRRNRFTKSIYVDPDSSFEITFMTLPLMKISKKGFIVDSGEKFDNMKYGIIVRDSKGRRATFLPEVFENATWDEISNELANKARVTSDDIDFYAYRGVVWSRSIMNHFIEPVLLFLNKYYREDIPYEIINGNIVTRHEQYVRNIATIREVMQAMTNSNTSYETLDKSITRDIRHYVDKFMSLLVSQEDSKKIRQAIPFLIMCVRDNESYVEQLEKMIKYLLSELPSIKTDDPIFEYGEVITGLAYAINTSNLSRIVVSSVHDVMKEEISFIESQIKNISQKSESIFQLNWLSQSIREMYESRIDVHPDIPITLFKKLTSIIPYILNDKSIESNYLCVAFEACSALYNIIDDQTQTTCDKLIERLMRRISQRINKNGLVEFTDGSIRLDMTGHFLNGINYLHHQKHQSQSQQRSVSKGGTLTHYVYSTNKQFYLSLCSES